MKKGSVKETIELEDKVGFIIVRVVAPAIVKRGFKGGLLGGKIGFKVFLIQLGELPVQRRLSDAKLLGDLPQRSLVRLQVQKGLLYLLLVDFPFRGHI